MRCADAADAAGDAREGTAPPAERWFLLEHPGPWGRVAFAQSGLDAADVEALSEWATRTRGRVLLVRRPGRTPVGAPRRWFRVDSRRGHEEIRTGAVAGPLAPDAPGEVLDEALCLVCAHGRHDTCCAMRGRPVAAALAAARPEQTWECSHVGGDRFAANLVVLPHGLYYGRVDEGTVVEVAEAHERGDVVPRLLRGRARWLPAAQAAQQHARERHGDSLESRRIGAYEPAGTIPLGDGRWQVRLRHDGGYLFVTVAATARPEKGLLTCHAVNAAHPPAFDVVDVIETSSSM